MLTVAGSDSGGGAGIQADLRTFNAFGVYGCSVITAVTAQNPGEVRRVDVLPVESVVKQFESVLDAIPVRFVKTGMLANGRIIEAAAELAAHYGVNLIVDPVMVSTSGTVLLEESAIGAMQSRLFPLARWITPNIPEAELICRRQLKNPGDLADAALCFYEQFGCNCLLKSGHAIESDLVTDIVCYKGEIFTLSSPVVKLRGNTAHGTGCTLSAAMAANFALNKNWQDTLIAAKAFVYSSLYESIALSDTLMQMYPPGENRLNQIQLNRGMS